MCETMCRKLQQHASPFPEEQQPPQGLIFGIFITWLMDTAFPSPSYESVPSFQLYLYKCPERNILFNRVFDYFFSFHIITENM